jgi:ribose-phosphate pyrophosphokinase
MIVLPMPGSERFAQMGHDLGGATGLVQVHRFPDGEGRVRITGALGGEDVVLVAGLDRPDEKVVPLLFAAATARDLGAASVGLVAPYLPYLRQDRRFRAGEGVSARYFCRLLSSEFDWVVTVDPHLHRIGVLEELFTIPAEAAHAAPLLADWIARNVQAPLVIGPDAESLQWAASIAQRIGAPHAVLAKRRAGDRRVEITLPDLAAHAGRQPVLVDDVISSGETLAAAVRALRAAGWPAPVCLAVHPVFAAGAETVLAEAGAGGIVTCNTVAHPSAALDVQDLLAAAASRRLRALSGPVPPRPAGCGAG